jgi:hypothetical protein
MVTPLEQAKAWATYVMFGAGMFAAGRVEEAFRALETEYQLMDYRSQNILFEEPNTTFQGINESNRLDNSTFREAVGRYNYLAVRVPGAEGLNTASNYVFSWLAILYLLLAVSGFTFLINLIKSRKNEINLSK